MLARIGQAASSTQMHTVGPKDPSLSIPRCFLSFQWQRQPEEGRTAITHSLNTFRIKTNSPSMPVFLLSRQITGPLKPQFRKNKGQ